jgi:hypothetical protein
MTTATFGPHRITQSIAATSACDADLIAINPGNDRTTPEHGLADR